MRPDEEVELPDPQLAALKVLAGAQDPTFAGDEGPKRLSLPMGPLPQQAYGQPAQPAITRVPGASSDYDPQLSPSKDLSQSTPQMDQFVNAPAQQQLARAERGFDWGRALTAFGGGDVGAYDARHNRQEDAPQRQFAFGRAQADAQYEDQDRALKMQQARDAMNPQSAVSRDAQKQYRDSLNVLANSPGIPDSLKAHFASQVDAAGNMTASQVAKAQLNLQSMFGNVMKAVGTQANADLAAKKMALTERGVLAQEAMTPVKIADIQQDNALQGAKLSEDIRHHQALEEAPIKIAQEKSKADQDKLNKEINDIDQSIDQMKQLQTTKPSVNTGPLAGRVQSLLAKVDLAPDEFVELKSLTSRLFNKETKTLAGSAVTPSEWARIEPQIPSVNDDDRTYQKKLSVALRAATEILSKRREEYRMKGGAPLDKSVTAQRNSPLLPGNTDASRTPNQVIDPGKADRARKALADRNASAKAKAGAQAYLDSLK